ncbi:protein MTSS 1-like protein, partial [Lates japonicus]
MNGSCWASHADRLLWSLEAVQSAAAAEIRRTRDISFALTGMAMRHITVFLDCLINPLQEQMEEWKRVANTLDKDHAK